MIRIGHAWDTHKLILGRNLILGGVKIEKEMGLLGHSDADCVLHSIAEAFLGALALGDLGKFYPDNSDKTLNMDSKIILAECYKRILDLNYHLVNLDLTIYTDYVRISPIRDKIRENIANILNVDISLISVKATTHEGLGFIGENKAIASECVLLISDEND